MSSFGHAYKSTDKADYYAHKHDSSLMRRVSNSFERRIIRRSLDRVARLQPFTTVLDCPSGTGRFLPTLREFNASVVAMDSSGEMLAEGRRFYDRFPQSPGAVVGSALDVPMPDDAVDVVLCSRLLHHFPDRESRVRILNEFARVARYGVVASFFDATSYRGWRRTKKNRRRTKKHGRYAVTRSEFTAEADEAGLELLGMNAVLRYHTEITSAAFLVGSQA